MIHHWSIARRLFVAHLLFVLSLTAVVGTATFVDARDHAYNEAGRRMAAVATAVADSPLVLDAAGAADPSALLQPYALKVMKDADADFITIMAPDRTRWTHPDPAQIGRSFIGSIEPALSGTAFTETFAGTLGPSVRAVAPIRAATGAVIGLVAVGITTETINKLLMEQLPFLMTARSAPEILSLPMTTTSISQLPQMLIIVVFGSIVVLRVVELS